MMTSSHPSDANRGVLPVGDPRRKPIGRAVAGTLLTAAAFVVFAWITKHLSWLSLHSPWGEDPYDAVVSFTFFFVPLAAGFCLIRVPLVRQDQPQPVERMVDLLRGCRVALAAVLITLAADWTSVLLRADQTNWSASTAILIALLAATTVPAVVAAVVLRRAPDERLLRSGGETPTTDWFADVLMVADQASRHIGILGPVARRAIRWTDRHAVSAVRRRPMTVAAVAALGFGATIAVSAFIEDGVAPILALFFVVGASGMFAFLVLAGSYLGLVRGRPPAVGRRRRLIDAAVISSGSVPVALAFRTSLWGFVGSTDASAGLGTLVWLLTGVAVGVFVVILVTESVAGIHRAGNGR